MVELIEHIEPEHVRANLERVREQVLAAGRRPADVQVLAAVKYLAEPRLAALAQAGVTLAGENRAQELAVKAAAHPEFTWDFIGTLQSRKVPMVLPYVRYIHSVGSESAIAQLEKHGSDKTRILIEVNVAGEPGKSGVAPGELGDFLHRAPVPVVGLMTMPPRAERPEQSRPHFRALRDLAERYGLGELSMGTSQDYGVAVEEGATIIRLGSVLYEPPAP